MNNKDKIGKPPLAKSPYVKNIPTHLGTTLNNTTKNTNKLIPMYISSNSKQSTKSNSNVVVKIKDIISSLSTTSSNHISAVIINDTRASTNKPNEIVTEADNTHFNTMHNHNQPSSFATIPSNEKPSSREQALVFNSIDGIRQVEYILAIGKLISQKDIIFILRISNNRFVFSSQVKKSSKLYSKNLKLSQYTNILYQFAG